LYTGVAAMSQRPKVILFDVVDTLFSLEPLDARLREVGLDGGAAPLWLARTLRDAFALEIAGLWRPYREVAGAALTVLAAERGLLLDDPKRERVLSLLNELPAHPDARPALDTARAAGVTCACLSNHSVITTSALLAQAQLDGFIARILSADEIQHWKPLWDIYLHAADALGIDPHEIALVSAHAWDIEGARQASLTTAWVAREESSFSPLVAAPDVSAGSLVEAVERLLGLPRAPQVLSRNPTETLH
jgi:2-haloacid dehalogenase